MKANATDEDVAHGQPQVGIPSGTQLFRYRSKNSTQVAASQQRTDSGTKRKESQSLNLITPDQGLILLPATFSDSPSRKMGRESHVSENRTFLQHGNRNITPELARRSIPRHKLPLLAVSPNASTGTASNLGPRNPRHRLPTLLGCPPRTDEKNRGDHMLDCMWRYSSFSKNASCRRRHLTVGWQRTSGI